MEHFFVGTYSEPILFGTGEVFQGKGKGVYYCSFDGKEISVVSELPLSNPSFLCVDEKRRKVYAVNELKEFQGESGGGVTEITYDENGAMEANASFTTGGTDPCHIVMSPKKDLLVVSNFASGSLAVYELGAEGEILPGKQFFQHEGSSVHPVRQRGPHAHSAIFVGDHMMLVPDLGIDQLVAYSHWGGRVTPEPARGVSLPAGSGPRYGELSPDGKHFYLINEIASSVTHFERDGEHLTACKTVGTLPKDFAGDNICSDLHITPDGKHLYASNRGHDSLSAYRIGVGGELDLLQHYSCRGKTPRNFAITPSGKYLLVGNQSSDTIVAFVILTDGALEFVSETQFPTPVCIRFLREDT